MDKSVRSAACLTAAALLMAACSSSDKPYAHEAMGHPTAAEQQFGTTGSGYTPPPESAIVVTEPAVVVAEPPVVGQTAPMTAPQPVPQTVARMAPSDAMFAQQALSSSAVEIELARIAYVRAQSPEVRAFARQMLIDHREMAIKLDNFALERGYLVAWRIEPDKSGAIERLRSLDSASFDRAYMDEMVAAHEKAAAAMEMQAASTRETAAIATGALPIVRHHLEMARALDAKL